MKKMPPGFTKCATTRAQPRISGSQPSTPRDVYTTSNVTVEPLREVVHVRCDEARVQAELRRQSRGELDRLGREVRPRDVRAQPRPRQRVDPEMALEVQERLAVHVADLFELVVAQTDPSGAELVQAVEVRRFVDAGPLVPQLAVAFEELVHGRSVSSRVLGRPAPRCYTRRR